MLGKFVFIECIPLIYKYVDFVIAIRIKNTVVLKNFLGSGTKIQCIYPRLAITTRKCLAETAISVPTKSF